MKGAANSPPIWQTLTWLRGRRRRFRIQRGLQRMLSPRRIIASGLTVFFVIAYFFSGVYILSARQPADPARLMLWLSGGMVIYGIYYSVRCAWSDRTDSLEMTAAESLWLGGAPVSRALLAVNHVAGLIPAALMKTILLAVVLARDVKHIELMVIGVVTSLILLEIFRITISRWSAGLSSRGRQYFRIATSAIAAAAISLTIATIFAETSLHSPTWVYILNAFGALGSLATCEAIQWLSIPWIAPAQLAVTQNYTLLTSLQLAVSIALIPLATWLLVQVDLCSSQQIHRQEQRKLQAGLATAGSDDAERNRIDLSQSGQHWIYALTPKSMHLALSIAGRHSVSVRRYRWAILCNFALPTLLCLSPLLTGQAFEQWLYIVGGIALCTMLLAPPALKIDFRRDLRRMLLVRSLPVPPLTMVIGTLLTPVLITWIFQWVTIAVGALFTSPEPSQIVLWAGMLNALAVFTFAIENALFLAYPHHEKAEGIGMMIRAKLTFLGKGTVLIAALTLLVLWSFVCRTLPDPLVQPIFITGAVIATWLTAAAALASTTFCWRRFDTSIDIPPQ